MIKTIPKNACQTSTSPWMIQSTITEAGMARIVPTLCVYVCGRGFFHYDYDQHDKIGKLQYLVLSETSTLYTSTAYVNKLCIQL